MPNFFCQLGDLLYALGGCQPAVPPPPPPVGASPFTVALVNRSTVVSSAQLAQLATDLQTQLFEDVQPLWGSAAQVVVRQPQAGDWVLYIEDDSTIPGAGGYHEDVNGVPTGHVFARTVGSRWTLVASHELIEMLVDPRTNMIVSVDNDQAGTSGTEYYAEACDAVEQAGYQKGQTTVSDFVGPAWFDPLDKTGPYDFLRKLSAPLELLPGGSYIGTRTFTSPGWSQKTAQK